MFYKASAPANLMMIGEYTVLSGYPAVVCAVNRRLHCQLTPRDDQQIHIQSQLGNLTLSAQNPQAEKPFDLIAACLQQHALPSGCDMVIDSEFSHRLGLGSSAALVATLCHCLAQWLRLPTHIESLWLTGIRAIRSLHPNSSGADLAASLHGGMIEFKNQPLHIRALDHSPELAVIYSGSKLETPTAVQSYQQQKKADPERIDTFEAETAKLSTAFIAMAQLNDWQNAGKILNCAHQQLQQLNVSNEKLDRLTQAMQQASEVYGAKISGSGHGDCLIGIGSLTTDFLSQADLSQGCLQLPLAIDPTGVKP